MKVLIFGATGNIGRLTVKEAIAAGHEVTGFARSPEKLEMESENLHKVSGDAMDVDSVDAAMPGHDAVIIVFGVPVNWSTLTSVPDLCTVGTQNIIASMKRHNVQRLICMTGIGAGDSKGHGRFVYNNVIQPLILGRIYTDKNRQEKAVKESNLNWTIVRPSEFTDKPAEGQYKAWTNLEGKKATTISRADVADFLVKQMSSEEFLHKTTLITD